MTYNPSPEFMRAARAIIAIAGFLNMKDIPFPYVENRKVIVRLGWKMLCRVANAPEATPIIHANNRILLLESVATLERMG